MTTSGKPSASPRIRAIEAASSARDAQSSVDLFERMSRSALISAPPERAAVRGLGETLSNMAAKAGEDFDTPNNAPGEIALRRVGGRT